MAKKLKTKEYNIKKGKHSSGFKFGFTFNNSIYFRGIFDKSCIYSIENNDKYDINKLFGLSCSYHHHIQSARLGWRCLDGENIEVFTYTYDDEFRKESKLIGTVKTEEEFQASITITKKTFVYKFNDTTLVIPKTKRSWKFKYFLYPYFGGDETAPHDMKITIMK